MELKANELRIGNLIYQWRTDIPFEVGIDDLKIIQSGESKARPIPLTEEWLLKFGFEKNFENLIEILINKNQSLHFDKTDNCMSLYIPINHEFIYLVFKHIKYIHELQNLFFALTGEELEIKQ